MARKLSEVIAEIQQIESDGGDASELRGKVSELGYGDRLPAPPTMVDVPETPQAPEPDGFSFSEMVSNIPESAGQAASNLWQAVSSPVDTATALGQTAMGGLQHLQDQFPESVRWMAPPVEGDYRPQASAVGQAMKERYGGTDELRNTLETDPVGSALDVGGLFGLAAPATAAKLNPVTRAAGNLAQRAGTNMMESAAKFSTVIPPKDRAKMVGTMMDEGISPSSRGVEKLGNLIDQRAGVVDDLISQADAAGGTIPIGQVLRRLNNVKRERGKSLVGGGKDIDAVDQFIDDVIENASRLGKRDMSASDLQKMKRDLYDQIAWNARRQVDEVPVLEETRKTTARAAKEEIEGMIPEVGGANERLGGLLELRPNLERAASRIENRDIFGMTDAFSLGAGGLAGFGTGSPALGIGATAAIELFSNPKISPTVARGIYNVGKGVASPAGQTSLALPYFGGALYYAGERGALEDAE